MAPALADVPIARAGGFANRALARAHTSHTIEGEGSRRRIHHNKAQCICPEEGNWKSRKAGTGTGTENWERSSGTVPVCMQYIAWLLLTPMILEVVTIKGWLNVSTIVGVSLALYACANTPPLDRKSRANS